VIFLDTSAVFAVLDPDDESHLPALAAWNRVLTEDEPIVTTSYVLLESFALVQRRLGLDAVRDLSEDWEPILNIVWLEERDHVAGVTALLIAGRRDLSLVDCTSFEIIRRLGIRRCFTFDPHFRDQGFEVIP